MNIVFLINREIRKVPADWVHPKDKSGCAIPLFEGSYFTTAVMEWDKDNEQWQKGFRSTFVDESDSEEPIYIPIEDEFKEMTFTEWDGERPNPQHYMPVWEEKQKTHFMLYETCTEGTSMSPAFPTKEGLVQWMVINNISSYAGRHPKTYAEWIEILS